MLHACTLTSEPQLNPNDPYASLSQSDVYLQMGIQYMGQGMLEIALTNLNHAVELDGNNSEVYNALGVLHDRLRRYDAADGYFQKAIAINGENYSARNNLGRYLCERGRHHEGMAQFQQVIAAPLYPQPWVPLTNAGLCAEGANQRKEAEEFFRKALERNPRFPPALLEMAKLSLASREYLSARGFLQRYQNAASDSPASLWVGAQTEMALGGSESAQSYLAKLRRQFPDSQEARMAEKLGGAY